MKKNKKNLQLISEIAIYSALALALDFLQGGIWKGVFPNGGSIGISMLPILIISYRRGFGSGLVCGFIVSILQMLGGIYIVAMNWYAALAQVSLDYVITFPLVAFAGLFHKAFQNTDSNKKKVLFLSLGTFLGGTLKFLAHFISGVVFFTNFNFPGGPVLYSIVYNGAYMLPNIIINLVILVVLALKQPMIFIPKQSIVKEQVR